MVNKVDQKRNDTFCDRVKQNIITNEIFNFAPSIDRGKSTKKEGLQELRKD